ncbi:MAG: hypothetical protein FD169_1018 [Bacillota bacterium]|nr:MAG: hypothetical protein FD169_1018 [Bacillota bacterium]MBS3949459.1 hypothetical protein [Peptococcaceae bacterium]
MNISTSIWTWVMAFCTLGILSFLYKENPVYRAAEHIFIGSAAGHAIGIAVGSIHRFGWKPLFEQGQYLLVIPFLLGLMLYTRFFKKVSWLSRWPIAFLVGVGTGVSLFTMLRSQVIAQAEGAMVRIPAIVGGQISIGVTLNNIITVVGLLAVLTYFIFSIPQKGPVRLVSQAGRFVMMITFGVAFGNVVAGRISILLGQLKSLLGTWLGLIS